MSANKVEMSLDEIIKANKKKDNTSQRTSGKKGGASGRSGVTKRKPGFTAKKNSGSVQKRGRPVQGRKNVNNSTSRNNNNNRFKKSIPRNIVSNKRSNPAAVNTIATKRLVQNLVKKALAQRNVGVRNRVSAATPTAIHRRGGVRLVKKTVVLNRVSPRSRVIAPRRRVVPVTTLKPQRAQIRYNTVPQTVQIVSPAPVRRNYVPARQRKFVNRRPIVMQQQARPAYQLVQVPLGGGNGRAGGSVRQQINAMRRGTVYVSPQQQQRRPQRQQQQFRQRPRQQRQQQVTYVEQQPRQRFQNRRRQQQQNFSPFYEPPSFLQRIPVSQPTVVRRFQ